MKNKAGFWDDVTQALANGAMFYLGYSLVAMDTDIQDALYDIFFQYREQDSLSKEDVSDIKNKLNPNILTIINFINSSIPLIISEHAI